MNIVALIPARGGSKGLPGKNIKPLAGKPLIAHSIEVAQKVEAINRVIVSSDSEVIGAVAKDYGAEYFKRPDELATDHSLVIDTIKDVIQKLRSEKYNPDIMLLLEPTSPLRSIDDINKCIELLIDVNDGYDSVATFKPAAINPCRTWKIIANKPNPFIDEVDPWQPRQLLPDAYQLDGYVYAFRCNKILEEKKSILCGKLGAVITPQERSYDDIDTALDFLVIETILKKRSIDTK